MSYINASDLISRFGAEELAQVADNGLPRLVTSELLAAMAAGDSYASFSAEAVAAGSRAISVIAQAIEDAQSAIDGYLSSRYATPMAHPPAVIKRLACDIARYFLHDDQATDTVKKRYDDAVSFFRDVAGGKVSLGPEVQVEKPSGGGVQVVSGGSVFGRGVRGF